MNVDALAQSPPSALGWDTVLFTVTIPGWLMLAILLTVYAVTFVLLARWVDRRWLDPWLRRRVGLPPKQMPEHAEL